MSIPAARASGLGRALAIAGLNAVHDHAGIDTGMLFVAADNEPALALYRALGFTVHRVDRAYECEVPAPMTASESRRYDYRRAELEALVATLGEPAYRGRQLFEGLYLRRHPLDELTDLPKRPARRASPRRSRSRSPSTRCSSPTTT